MKFNNVGVVETLKKNEPLGTETDEYNSQEML